MSSNSNHGRSQVPSLIQHALNLGRSTAGVTALLFAMTLLPFIMAAGAAVDIGRAYVVRARLAYALDAAGLAVGSAPNTDPAELQVILEDFFRANYPEERLGVPAEPVMELVGDEIHLSAEAVLPTTLMNIIGIDSLTVATTAVIIKETKGIEVAMVLDVTGSMQGSKLEALKFASHTFIDILFGDATSNPLLKIGIVPFSATVNIGTGMSGFVKDNPGAPNRFGTQGWRGCVEVRPYPNDVLDTYTASNAVPNGRWRAYAWAPHSSQNNWPSITPTRGPNKGCHFEDIVPLTSTKSPLHAAIDELVADGNTNIPIGAVWGWYVLSPQQPFTQGSAYGDEDFSKAMVLMTDGENNISTTTGTYSAYGTVAQATTKLGCSTATCKETAMDNRLLEICANMKAADILIYTIGFALPANSPILTLLESCATDPSKFFNSPSNASLQAAFEAIGNELSNLRIGQ